MTRAVVNSDSGVLFQGDCRESLKELPDSAVDSVVTDPPYELGFMGKSWDASGIAYDVDLWREVLRVLKPGGHMLAFGATRTYHRMTCAIEDAGFEIRDSLHWIYGTGFPKSMKAGDGRGTALKPAHEPIVMARKPLIGTVEKNLAAHGTGAINIDASRIGTTKDVPSSAPKDRIGQASKGNEIGRTMDTSGFDPNVGRWPANVLFDVDAAGELDLQSGTLKSGSVKPGTIDNAASSNSLGASRFFYVAKPSRAERDAGLEHLTTKSAGEATGREEDTAGFGNPAAGAGRTGGARNFHPTVKPVQLMRYLVKLVTPPRGIVLEPFAGSGTTLLAAQQEGLRWIGCELTPEYLPIILGRLGLRQAEAT